MTFDFLKMLYGKHPSFHFRTNRVYSVFCFFSSGVAVWKLPVGYWHLWICERSAGVVCAHFLVFLVPTFFSSGVSE